MGDTHFSGMVYSKGVPTVGMGMLTVGKIFFVNGQCSVTRRTGDTQAASDGNPGTKDRPFETIKHALDQCVDRRGDLIYVLDFYDGANEDWPIVVDVRGVSIIGAQSVLGGPWGGRIPWALIYASGSKAAFHVTAIQVLISGFQIYAGSSSYACVTMDNNVSVVTIDNCRFCRGTYGVHLTSTDTEYGINVINCSFEQMLASGGILYDDDPPFCVISGNYFDRVQGVAIDIRQGGADRIVDNTIAMGANTHGYAITLASAVSRCLVNNNYAAWGAENGTITPFLDNGTVTTNNWGRNFFGANAVAPG